MPSTSHMCLNLVRVPAGKPTRSGHAPGQLGAQFQEPSLLTRGIDNVTATPYSLKPQQGHVFPQPLHEFPRTALGGINPHPGPMV